MMKSRNIAPPVFSLAFVICCACVCTLVLCCTYYMHSGEHFFKPATPPPGSVAVSRRKIVNALAYHEGRVTFCSGSYYIGRTGNQLFKLAALLYVARSTGRQIHLPTNIPGDWIDAYFDMNITRSPQTADCPCVTAEERAWMRFDPIFDRLGDDPNFSTAKTIFICGYFQSWKYTSGIETELRRMLRFRPEVWSAVTNFLRENVSTEVGTGSYSTVGIHIRRGDFLRQSGGGFTIADATYLHNAVKYYIQLNRRSEETRRKSLIFVVCSDDPGWAKATIGKIAVKVHTDVRFVFSDGASPGFDMCLLSRCQSLIISTGSFGWWAAWLANRTTVYYFRFPKIGSELSIGFKRDDYYPQDWIPMLWCIEVQANPRISEEGRRWLIFRGDGFWGWGRSPLSDLFPYNNFRSGIIRIIR